MKILLQSIWKLKLGWDELLPGDILEMWIAWSREIFVLQDFVVPRCVVAFPHDNLQLHIFADASPRAYGAVAYIRCSFGSQITVNLLMAKNRVAPIKQSNSKIALYWIRGDPSRWKSYVANRVNQIRELSDISMWRHCPGVDNPADLLTRGVKAKILIESTLWKNGPCWLTQEIDFWPNEIQKSVCDINAVQFHAISKFSNESTDPLFNLEKFSSFQKILRVTAYIKIFIYNSRNLNKIKTLTANEMNEAEIYWIKYIQRTVYNSEIDSLEKKELIDKSSGILKLSPFLDDTHILRLGGRLQEADLPFEMRHSIIIPKSSPFTHKLIIDKHLKSHHGGVNLTLSRIREKYWIIKGRQSVKSVISKCLVCRRMRCCPEYLQQLRSVHFTPFKRSSRLRVGQVVLLYEQGLPRLLWKLARIEEVFPGRDGYVRACLIRLGNGTLLRRPVQLLYPLEIEDDIIFGPGEDVKNSKQE
ncbi:hypothetical protein JTB14_035357 [Gonioctena quinquepunctata]|nr:hypothetical protein JTB14_035357 [Gonioctena quinquepunctata]